MKSILLASAATFAFAGAAAAEITFSGSADLGYNDTIATGGGDNNFGFYSDLDITAGFAAELDNGLTVAASLDLEDLGSSSNGQSYELSLTSADAGLYYGDTAFAAENLWVSAGSMDNDGFSEADGEEALRGEATFGAVTTQLSYVLANNAGTRNAVEDANQLSLAMSADFGNYNVVLAYQDASSEAAGFYSSALGTDGDNGDFTDAEVFGLSVGTTFSGVDVRLAYAESGGASSTGLSASYTTGPVTFDASYVSESAGADNWDLGVTYADGPISVTVNTDESDDWGLEGSYDVGNGLVVYAGLDDAGEDYYLGGEYDLGGGASLLVSFAEDDDADNGDDEIGAQDYQEGTTIELSFEF